MKEIILIKDGELALKGLNRRTFENILMKNMRYRLADLGRFTFKNMVCTGTEVAACYVDGLPEMPVDSVTLQNIRVSYAENAREGVPAMMTNAQKRRKLGLYFDNVRRVVLKDVVLRGTAGEALQAQHCGEVRKEGFRVEEEA